MSKGGSMRPPRQGIRRSPALLMLIALIGLAVPLRAQPSKQPPMSSMRYRVLFFADRNGNGVAEPYVMDDDGANVRALVTEDALTEEAEAPAASAALAKTPELAGTLFRTASGQDLYRVDAEGVGRRLTRDAGVSQFQVSPDGTKILIMTRKDDDAELYVVDAAGGTPVNLTHNPADDENGSWSPDGTRILFSSDRDGDDEIYTMDAGGTNITQLTHNSASDTSPAWSPDGSKIAFDSDRDGNHEIYVMSADGSDQTRLTSLPADDGLPSWSPDGTRIMFVSDRDGHPDAYTMDPDGSHLKPLTSDGIWRAPMWSPDGTRVAFMSEKDGNLEIYVMHADGTHIRRLTNDEADDLFDRWLPMTQAP